MYKVSIKSNTLEVSMIQYDSCKIALELADTLADIEVHEVELSEIELEGIRDSFELAKFHSTK